jgi:hypothetical protein
MTASTKPKTPSMRIAVRPGRSAEEIKKFCKAASRLTLSQVVESVVVTEKLAAKQGQRNKVFTIKINFFPEEEYRAEYDITPAEIKGSFGIKFAQVMKKEIQMELKKLDADLKNQISALGKGKAEREPRGSGGAPAEEAEDEPAAPADDGASEVGDGDADTAKRARQQEEQVSYESDEDSDEELNDEAIEAIYTEPEEKKETGGEEKPKAKAPSSVEQLFYLNLPAASSFKFTAKQCTIQLTVSQIHWCVRRRYSQPLVKFGADMPKLLLVGLVERTCTKTVVREIPGIVDCFQLAGDDNKGKIVVRSPDRVFEPPTSFLPLRSSLLMAQTSPAFGNSPLPRIH